MGISIIIVNYNGSKYITNCLKSIIENFADSNITFEILIIDNNSTDDSIVIIKKFIESYDDQIRLFESDENLGFSKGNNFLAKEAKYEYLMLLNNDTLILDLAHLKFLIVNHQITENTIYSCKILNADLTVQNNLFRYPKTSYLILELFLIKKLLVTHFSKKSKNKSFDYFGGCFFIIKRSLFQSINGFDEDFFFYHEECDLFLRLEKEAIKKTILDDRIIHFGSGGNTISHFSFVNYYKNLYKLYTKHNKKTWKLLFKQLFILSFRFRLLLLKLNIKFDYNPFFAVYKSIKCYDIKSVEKMHQVVLEDIRKM